MFASGYATLANQTFNLITDDAIVARYGQTKTLGGLDLGVNLGRDSDLRLGATIDHIDADVKIGDPGLPAVRGKETEGHLMWRLDTQDSNVIPSRGTLATVSFDYTFDGPVITVAGEGLETDRSSAELPQLSAESTVFRRRGDRGRLFTVMGGGTSFGKSPLPVHQFTLGRPLHLGAYNVGEVRGDHYFLATVGYLRELGRMPDFIGGKVWAGGWLENGDAFNDWEDATIRTHVSGGVVLDTLVGPVILAGSAGFDGRWRTYVGIGRLFR